MKAKSKILEKQMEILAKSDVILKRVITLQYQYMKHTEKLNMQDSASFVITLVIMARTQ